MLLRGHRFTGRRRHLTDRRNRHGHRRRDIGWECVHVAIDDVTRLAYAEALTDETGRTAVGFLRRAIQFWRLIINKRMARFWSMPTRVARCKSPVADVSACGSSAVKWPE